MIVIGDVVEEIFKLLDRLSTKFKTLSLGSPKYFVDIKVPRLKQEIFLSQ